MDNRGKIWTIDQDQQLMENPQYSNQFYSQSMGRSENAIRFRRAHLALKLHQQRPETSLDEFSILMGADIHQAEALLEQWHEKQRSFNQFLDSRKRKAPDQPAVNWPAPSQAPDQPAVNWPAPSQAAVNWPAPSQAAPPREEKRKASPEMVENGLFVPRSRTEECISSICRSIKEEEGRLGGLWNDPDFVPYLVQFYPGFDAYSRLVQAQTVIQ